MVSTSDKAGPNMQLYQLHATGGEDLGVVHKTVNVYAPDRSIFFVSDAPHLLKTFRKNLFSSRPNGGKRLMKVTLNANDF